jgi:two-component system, OmpR family, sensor histidine kinase KdpD
MTALQDGPRPAVADGTGSNGPMLLPRPRLASLTHRRRLLGTALAVVGLPALTLALLQAGAAVDLSAALLCYLALTVLVAVVGGVLPSAGMAVAGFAVANWYFTPPVRTWTVDVASDVIALTVFLATGVVVGVLVDLVARRAAEVQRAQAESAALVHLTATVGHSDDPLTRLVEDVRATLDLDAAVLLAREGTGWRVEATAGDAALRGPEDATTTVALDATHVLALRGARSVPEDRRILTAFAAQLALAIERQRLEAAALRAEGLAAVDRLRNALLSAVSHDLRTPLATIKAWLTGLLTDDVTFDPSAVREILGEAVGEVDRLNALVGNLLDMSRLQAGAVQVRTARVDVGAVAAAAVAGLGYGADQVKLELPDTLPEVMADSALLERILANLIDNAVRHAGNAPPCIVTGHSEGSRLEIRVSDRGPGIPIDVRGHVFEPFARLGDRGDGGVGLGLAVARGLGDAIGADLSIDGAAGGTTMVLRLRQAG